MNGSLESCFSYSLILVTFALTICQSQGQGQDRACTLTASPHPNGLCGEKLAQAHANLCFLLARAYPDIFGKRSSPSLPSSSLPESLPSSYFSQRSQHNGQHRLRRGANEELLERIYSIPLPVLAQLNINEDNWRSFVEKREAEGKADEFHYTDKDLEMLSAGPTRQLIRMLRKRSLPAIQKRSVGLVCECCINSCLPRQMATYC